MTRGILLLLLLIGAGNCIDDKNATNTEQGNPVAATAPSQPFTIDDEGGTEVMVVDSGQDIPVSMSPSPSSVMEVNSGPDIPISMSPSPSSVMAVDSEPDMLISMSPSPSSTREYKQTAQRAKAPHAKESPSESSDRVVKASKQGSERTGSMMKMKMTPKDDRTNPSTTEYKRSSEDKGSRAKGEKQSQGKSKTRTKSDDESSSGDNQESSKGKVTKKGKKDTMGKKYNRRRKKQLKKDDENTSSPTSELGQSRGASPATKPTGITIAPSYTQLGSIASSYAPSMAPTSNSPSAPPSMQLFTDASKGTLPIVSTATRLVPPFTLDYAISGSAPKREDYDDLSEATADYLNISLSQHYSSVPSITFVGVEMQVFVVKGAHRVEFQAKGHFAKSGATPTLAALDNLVRSFFTPPSVSSYITHLRTLSPSNRFHFVLDVNLVGSNAAIENRADENRPSSSQPSTPKRKLSVVIAAAAAAFGLTLSAAFGAYVLRQRLLAKRVFGASEASPCEQSCSEEEKSDSSLGTHGLHRNDSSQSLDIRIPTAPMREIATSMPVQGETTDLPDGPDSVV